MHNKNSIKLSYSWTKKTCAPYNKRTTGKCCTTPTHPSRLPQLSGKRPVTRTRRLPETCGVHGHHQSRRKRQNIHWLYKASKQDTGGQINSFKRESKKNATVLSTLVWIRGLNPCPSINWEIVRVVLPYRPGQLNCELLFGWETGNRSPLKWPRMPEQEVRTRAGVPPQGAF